MHKGIFAVSAALVLGTLSGCAGIQPPERTVLRYNRAFAQSRNEMLLLNVLRAAAREPLQFSAMGTVSGDMTGGAQIEIPFTNIIAGGADSISPTLTINGEANPSITIVPLANKEFVSGILTPLGLDDIQLFLHSGWDAEFLLPLIVGGVICPGDGRVLLNSGEYIDETGGTQQSDAFRDFFYGAARQFAIAPSNRTNASFTLDDEHMVDLLRQGAGEGRTISEVERIEGAGGRVRVTIESTGLAQVVGIEGAIVELCARLPANRRSGHDLRIAGNVDVPGAVAVTARATSIRSSEPPAQHGRIIFRSVASIIQFLGESHRIRFRASTANRSGLTYYNRQHQLQQLFRILWENQPDRRAVEMRFQDVDFWIPAIDLRADEGTDRTLKTLSFLDEAIALQTSADVVRGTQPLLAIGRR